MRIRPVPDVAPLRLPTSAPAVGQLRTGVVRVTSVGSAGVLVTGCSRARDTSACLYDSGAPSLRSVSGVPRLVSVESSGPNCPHSLSGTTSRVEVVAGWIRSVVPDLP